MTGSNRSQWYSTVTEHTEAGAGKVIERFIWATPSASQQALNLSGRYVRHYDTGGLHQRSALSVNGAVLCESRRLLRGDSQANWEGTDEQAWNALLDTDALTHQYQLDATDTLTTQIDPQLHRQRIAYDRLGLQKASWLRLNGQVEQPVVIAQHYSESGQLLRKEQGNGVLSTFTYDPCDLRLVGVCVERPAGHRLGAQRLQDLRYSYDPAGNVTAVEDTAQATRFWRNQQVPAQSRFVYDSLYLLWTQGRPDGVDNGALRYSYDDLIGSGGLEVDGEGALISREEYYPFGGTAVWAARNELEACYKTFRYSGKECDASGLYYYGHRCVISSQKIALKTA